MNNLIYAIVSVIGISLISLVGLFAISIREKVLDNLLFYILSFSSGAILGAAYFDLILEAVELIGAEMAVIYIALGFVFFYLLE